MENMRSANLIYPGRTYCLQVVSLEEEKKCQICMERDKDTAAQPCGHTACHQCMEKLPGKKCHVCRKVVKELLRIYS